MLPFRGRFGEKCVVDVTKLVGSLVPIHHVVGFGDPHGLLDVAGSMVDFRSMLQPNNVTISKKCYFQVSCLASAENFRFWLFCTD